MCLGVVLMWGFCGPSCVSSASNVTVSSPSRHNFRPGPLADVRPFRGTTRGHAISGTCHPMGLCMRMPKWHFCLEFVFCKVSI